jgi:hypothetical protein
MKVVESTRQKKGGMHISLSPRRMERGMKQQLQGLKKIGTDRAMKNHKKTMHELMTYVPREST